MQLLALLETGDVSSVEVRQEVHDAYDARLSDALSRTIWAHPGMTTYYRNAAGRVVIPMPWTNVDYLQMTHDVDLDDFLLEPAREPAQVQAG
jgi:4-hydroxyacetophenone monooxygenase